MHILAVVMLHQHKYCVYKGKRKLKLLITCEVTLYFLCFVNIFFLENWGVGGGGRRVREGWSGYSKHNFFFRLCIRETSAAKHFFYYLTLNNIFDPL